MYQDTNKKDLDDFASIFDALSLQDGLEKLKKEAAACMYPVTVCEIRWLPIPQTRIVYSNDTFCKTFKFTREQLKVIGWDIADKCLVSQGTKWQILKQFPNLMMSDKPLVLDLVDGEGEFSKYQVYFKLIDRTHLLTKTIPFDPADDAEKLNFRAENSPQIKVKVKVGSKEVEEQPVYVPRHDESCSADVAEEEAIAALSAVGAEGDAKDAPASKGHKRIKKLYLHPGQRFPPEWRMPGEEIEIVHVRSTRDAKLADRQKGDLAIDKNGKFKRFSGVQFVNICWRHRRRHYQCRHCGGKGICVHKRVKHQCRICWSKQQRTRLGSLGKRGSAIRTSDTARSQGAASTYTYNSFQPMVERGMQNGNDVPYWFSPYKFNPYSYYGGMYPGMVYSSQGMALPMPYMMHRGATEAGAPPFPTPSPPEFFVQGGIESQPVPSAARSSMGAPPPSDDSARQGKGSESRNRVESHDSLIDALAWHQSRNRQRNTSKDETNYEDNDGE